MLNIAKLMLRLDGTTTELLMLSANCIDRHLKNKKNKTAIIWVGDES